jgi:regulator of protease activity HflC (stomatin/prohibitin superfamily)
VLIDSNHMLQLLLLAFGVAAGVAAVAGFSGAFFVVEQRSIAVVQRFGRFVRQVGPGLHWKVPVVERIAGRLSLRVRQLVIEVDARTEDDVAVRLAVAVRYSVSPELIYEAFYRVDDLGPQLDAFVLEAVRAQVRRRAQSDVARQSAEIAEALQGQLAKFLLELGHRLFKVQITDVELAPTYRESLDRIGAARLEHVAAIERAEADRIVKIKSGEGDAQATSLRGKGTALARQAIASGMAESLQDLRRLVRGTTVREAMDLILMTQYFDMLREVATSPRAGPVFVPLSPATLGDLSTQMHDVLGAAEKTRPVPAQESGPAPEAGVEGPDRPEPRLADDAQDPVHLAAEPEQTPDDSAAHQDDGWSQDGDRNVLQFPHGESLR